MFLFLCSETIKWHCTSLAFAELAVSPCIWARSFGEAALFDVFLYFFYFCWSPKLSLLGLVLVNYIS